MVHALVGSYEGLGALGQMKRCQVKDTVLPITGCPPAMMCSPVSSMEQTTMGSLLDSLLSPAYTLD